MRMDYDVAVIDVLESRRLMLNRNLLANFSCFFPGRNAWKHIPKWISITSLPLIMSCQCKYFSLQMVNVLMRTWPHASWQEAINVYHLINAEESENEAVESITSPHPRSPAEMIEEWTPGQAESYDIQSASQSELHRVTEVVCPVH